MFDGDTEEAIRVYMGSDAGKAMQDIRTEDDMRPRNFRRPPCEITSIHFEKENTLDFGDQLVYTLENIFTILLYNIFCTVVYIESAAQCRIQNQNLNCRKNTNKKIKKNIKK